MSEPKAKKTRKTAAPAEAAPPVSPAPPGRPSKYREEFADQARKLCLLGATDVELADFFDVHPDTISEWKNVHEQFSVSIKKGKQQADADVADRLYQRAMGFEHDDVHVSNYQGDVTLTPIRKIHAPDTTAAIFWLKNRQSKKWRDKQEVEHTGNLFDSLLASVDGTGLKVKP
jgi:hypothetical protein